MCGGPALCTARPAPALELCRAISHRLGWQLAEAKNGRDYAPYGAGTAAVTEGLAAGGRADLGTLLTELRERLEAAMPNASSAAEAPDTPGGPCAALAEYAEEVAAAAQAASRQASKDSQAHDSGDKVEVQRGSCADAREDWTALFEACLFEDLPSRLLARLSSLPFEARKDAMRVFAALLRCGTAAPEARGDIVGYVRERPAIARQLLEGCGCAEAVLVCGQMLRACCRHEELVEFLLEGAGAALELVALTQNNSFDIAAEAFASLTELLLLQREVAAAYLERHFTEFFTAFNSMLQADDYVARRQGLRLLGEILLGSEFSNVMLRYVSSDRFLRLHMTLLLDTSPMVQLGAFHVVKIFIANPAKPLRVEQILRRNAERLRKRLEPLPAFRAEDECLGEDVRAVLDILRALPPESECLNARSPFSSSGSFSSGASTPAALDEPRVFDEPVAALEVTAAAAY